MHNWQPPCKHINAVGSRTIQGSNFHCQGVKKVPIGPLWGALLTAAKLPGEGEEREVSFIKAGCVCGSLFVIIAGEGCENCQNLATG